MTPKELKELLKQYRTTVLYTDQLIESMEYYLDSMVRREFPDYCIKETRKYLDQVIRRDRDRQNHARNHITSWSELISNETYRSMFVDHYLNGLTDDQIERKYHYSKTQVFHVRKKSIVEITEKMVITLEPGDQSLQAVE